MVIECFFSSFNVLFKFEISLYTLRFGAGSVSAGRPTCTLYLCLSRVLTYIIRPAKGSNLTRLHITVTTQLQLHQIHLNFTMFHEHTMLDNFSCNCRLTLLDTVPRCKFSPCFSWKKSIIKLIN